MTKLFHLLLFVFCYNILADKFTGISTSNFINKDWESRLQVSFDISCHQEIKFNKFGIDFGGGYSQSFLRISNFPQHRELNIKLTALYYLPYRSYFYLIHGIGGTAKIIEGNYWINISPINDSLGLVREHAGAGTAFYQIIPRFIINRICISPFLRCHADVGAIIISLGSKFFIEEGISIEIKY